MALTESGAVPRENIYTLLAGLSDSVQDYSALPNVDEELADISKSLKTDSVFLNATYKEDLLRQELASKNYRILHIAAHGEFDADPDKSYLLTYDDKLNLDELEGLIKLTQFREDPLELLTLSACRTAVGNERAALGLAGVALKSGARSAIATLWFVDDEATMRTMTEFYHQFQSYPEYSKAQALREAQLSLLKQKRYRHPAYWAPFLLIGNWL